MLQCVCYTSTIDVIAGFGYLQRKLYNAEFNHYTCTSSNWFFLISLSVAQLLSTDKQINGFEPQNGRFASFLN